MTIFKGGSRHSTLSRTTTPRVIAADALGMHVNVNIEPLIPCSYGIARSHSYTSGGVYQNWSGIEPTTKGVRDFTALDTWVNTNFAAGRKIILDMSGTPNWAVSAAAAGESPYPATKGNMVPDNDSDYTDFLTAVATRYAGKIYAYDTWNEPNLTKYYNGAAATVTRLATIQRKAYQAIKAADPSALVLSPCFTSVFSGIDGTFGNGVGLEQFLAASDGATGTGKDWFDHCAYHFYCNDSALRPTGLERMYRECRAALDAVGRSDAEIWGEETGAIVPGLQTLDSANQVALMRAYVIALFALGCTRVIWFSFDAGDIGFGTGSNRTALTDAWNQLSAGLAGATIQSAYVRTLNQSTMEVSITTNRGTVSQSISGMPL